MRRHSFLLKSRNGPRGLGAGAGAGRDESASAFDRLVERLFPERFASDAFASLERRLPDVDLEAQVPSSVVAQDNSNEETTARPNNFSDTNSYILVVEISTARQRSAPCTGSCQLAAFTCSLAQDAKP